MTALTLKTLDGEDRSLQPEALAEYEARLGGTLIRPGDADYDEARALWNGMIDVRPKTGTRIRESGEWNLLDPDILAWHAESELRQTRAFELVEFRLVVEPKAAHLAALRATGMNLKDNVAKARQNAPAGITVEVEVTNADEAAKAQKAGADIIMLDNMSIDEMKRVTDRISGQVKLEASGGVTLENVREVAMTGVDIISIGALTHSFRALDISLEMESQTLKLL